MKIFRGAFELAKAAGRESEVRLWLVGDRGIITDVVVAAYGEDPERCVIPVGMHRYGKVITKYDRFPEPGCNLVKEGGRWLFVDETGEEMPVEIIE